MTLTAAERAAMRESWERARDGGAPDITVAQRLTNMACAGSALPKVLDALDEAERIVQAARTALEQIRLLRGAVCPAFEWCTHPWCRGCAGAYLIAVDALDALPAAATEPDR